MGATEVTVGAGTDDTTVNIEICPPNIPPTADFTYCPLCPTNLQVTQFTDLSTDTDGMIVSWSWCFGDGGTSALPNPSHQFVNAGTYHVTLTVTDDDGASSSVSKDVVVINPAPVADANGPYTATCGLATFDGSGSTVPNSPCATIAYVWDFGDGSPHGSGVNPTHQYTFYGTFSVTLTVTVTINGFTYQDTDTTTATISGSVIVDKKVWDGTAWVDDIRVVNGTKVAFKITITNNGCIPFGYVYITDYLSTPQLKYLYDSRPSPSFAADNEIRWTTTFAAGQTIVIRYNASAVHTCYGWNSVYIKNNQGMVIGYDLAHVKVVNEAGQPALAISKLVWDASSNKWSDHIGLVKDGILTFKITVSSTELFTIHNVIVTDKIRR